MTKPRKAPSKYLTSAPDHVAAIYDNAGATHDRYTVIYTTEMRTIFCEARAMCERPFSPQR